MNRFAVAKSIPAAAASNNSNLPFKSGHQIPSWPPTRTSGQIYAVPKMSAALLMANLQANLRGQYALALEDVPRLLRSVNHLFYRNTETSHYATMFFAIYDDGTRRLRYVNCGHNPSILMRANGDLERLTATATVLGLFEEWDCAVAECELALGDVLVIYTDGISEAGPNEEEEFGEERLIAMIRKYQQQSAGKILDNILSDVQKVSRGRQADDMTLIVATCL